MNSEMDTPFIQRYPNAHPDKFKVKLHHKQTKNREDDIEKRCRENTVTEDCFRAPQSEPNEFIFKINLNQTVVDRPEKFADCAERTLSRRSQQEPTQYQPLMGLQSLERTFQPTATRCSRHEKGLNSVLTPH